MPMRPLSQSLLVALSLHVLVAAGVVFWGPLDRRVWMCAGSFELAALDLPSPARPDPLITPRRQAVALSVPEPRTAEVPADAAGASPNVDALFRGESLVLPAGEALHGVTTARLDMEGRLVRPDMAGEDRARLAALAPLPSARNGDPGLNRPVPLSAIRPSYPAEARREGREGAVVLRIHVADSGRVLRVEVARSSGHAALDNAAAEAVRRGIYKPAERDGRPAPGVLELTCIFKLQDPVS